MSTTSPSSPPKRPRLSLQIKALANGPSGRTSRCLAAAVDVKSPTAFNTLSNVYATAVDRSTPVHENPPTAILSRRPVLSLQTHDAVVKDRSAHNTPYLGPYLDTPITAQPISPAVVKDICFPSAAMTATPPLSAQPPEQNAAQVFTFEATITAAAVGIRCAKTPAPAAQNAKRRTTMPAGAPAKLPYTHPRCLRSILRNSPLPPLSTKSPESPRRQSLRLQEKAARRVAYNSPLTQTITTSKYTKSHIDLLAEDATPVSPSASASSSDDGDNVLDQAMADVGSDSTRDGGQTPGPFEEVRRRMANMQASTPLALSPTGGGVRKRGGKRREKKRRWVWTIGQDDDPDEGCESAVTPAATERKDSAPSASSVPASVSVPVLAAPAPRRRTRNQQAQLARAFAVAMQVQAPTQVPMLAVPVPPLRATSPPATARPCSPAPPPAPRAQPQPQPQHRPRAQSQSARPPTRELTPIPAFLLPDAPDSGRRRSYSSPEPCTTVATAGGASGIIRPLTPEQHLTMSMAMCMSPTGAEPPTPSAESTAGSVASSVFETAGSAGPGTAGDPVGTGAGDVDMSDASSVVCESDDAADEMDGAVDGRGWYRYRGCRYGYDGYGDGEARFGYNHKRLDDEGCGAGAGAAGGDGDVEMDEGTPTMTARPVGVRGWAPWREDGKAEDLIT